MLYVTHSRFPAAVYALRLLQIAGNILGGVAMAAIAVSVYTIFTLAASIDVVTLNLVRTTQTNVAIVAGGLAWITVFLAFVFYATTHHFFKKDHLNTKEAYKISLVAEEIYKKACKVPGFEPHTDKLFGLQQGQIEAAIAWWEEVRPR